MKKKRKKHLLSNRIPSFRSLLTLKSHLEPHPNREFMTSSFKVLVNTYEKLRPTSPVKDEDKSEKKHLLKQ